jgi:hypothetical protein
MMFPDEDAKSSTKSREQPFLASSDETFYFGLLVEYDSGEGTRKREFGSIFRCSKEGGKSFLKAWTK